MPAGLTLGGYVDRLEGEIPVGRWEAWTEHKPLAEIAKSSTAHLPGRSHVVLLVLATVLELRPDGTGYMLGLKSRPQKVEDTDYEPDYAFRVPGSPHHHLYARAAEMRWALGQERDWKSCNDPTSLGCLILLTTREERFALFRLTDDVLRITDDHYGTRRLLFRVGSPEAAAMVRFRWAAAVPRHGVRGAVLSRDARRGGGQLPGEAAGAAERGDRGGAGRGTGGRMSDRGTAETIARSALREAGGSHDLRQLGRALETAEDTARADSLAGHKGNWQYVYHLRDAIALLRRWMDDADGGAS